MPTKFNENLEHLEKKPQYIGKFKGQYKTSFLLKRNGPTDLNKMISKVYGVKWVRESDKHSVKTESRCGCMQYSCAESSNISKFMCGIITNSCAESSR